MPKLDAGRADGRWIGGESARRYARLTGRLRAANAGATRRAARLVIVLATLAVGAAAPSIAQAAPMCTTSFVPASGSWGTASNWTTGLVPSSSDVACVPSGAVVTTTGTALAGVVWAPDAKIVVAAGVLTVSDTVTASQLRDLTLSGGQLDGAATVNVSGILDWSGGSMVGSGATILGSTGTGTIHAGAYGMLTLATRTLRNDGTLSFSSGSLRGDTGALIDNRGTFSANSQDSTFSQGSGMYTNYNGAQARISNTGTIVKSAGTGRTWIGYAIDNDGVVSAQSGELYIYGGGVSGDTSTGAWNASAGADVNLAQGTFSLGSGIALSGTVLMEAVRSSVCEAAVSCW